MPLLHRYNPLMAMIRSQKDFLAGMMFVVFGVAVVYFGSRYVVGTAGRMGPGYFPRMLGALLVILGAAIAIRSVRVRGPRFPGLAWRPLLVILGSVVGFGLIIAHVGVFLSTIALIFCSSLASHEFRWKEALASGVFFALLAVAVFVFALKIPMPVWPMILSRIG